ncbi:hypothetical protein [Lentzea flava]|uniref:Patatin-like phospholipase n=1 Tax=Lentzea flava TaxID=103732 RepID=A0ABQ2UD54_9PSEU|nr:hypothetical protein [Lentzea flava]MCP2197928.1 hypothetical protein [Lentzea flava]GGU23443.1 hypothetical protein GCM10010178_14480 [Lentzea flava]
MVIMVALVAAVVLVLLVLAASWVLVAMGAMNSLLASVQVSTEQAGGVESLAWRLPPTGVVVDTQSILKAWTFNGEMYDIVGDVMLAYFVADFAYMVLYTAILYLLWSSARLTLQLFPPARQTWLGTLTMLRGRRRLRLLLILPVVDLVENSLRLLMFVHARSGVPKGVIWTSFSVTALKWLLVLVIAGIFAECLRSPALWAVLRERAWRLAKVVWRARLATVAVALFAGLVLLEPTGQVNDLIRQWYGNFWSGVGVVAATCVLGFAAGRSVHRLLIDCYPEDPSAVALRRRENALRLTTAVTCVVLAGLAVGFKLHPLWGISGVLVGILLLELLWRHASTVDSDTAAAAAQKDRRRDAGDPDPVDEPMIRLLAAVLTCVPLLALLLGAVKAYTPALFVVEENTISRDVIVLVSGILLAGIALGVFLCCLAAKFPAVLGAGVAVLIEIAVLSTVTDRMPIPSLVVLTVFLTLFLSGLTVAQRFSERWPVPKGLLVLGFSRIPVVLLLAAILGVCSLIADGSAHDARRTNDASPSSDGIKLKDTWTAWKAANCADGTESGEVPLVLVSSPGGGQRAAYWTASTLTDLFGTKLGNGCGGNPAAAVFALGGASGGSLGNTAWVATLDGAAKDNPTWYSAPFAESDPLTQPLAWMLSVDLARAYVGFGGPDRAAVLEDGVGRRVNGLHSSFFSDVYGTGGERPLLVLTGTQVETGCRIAISPVRLARAGQTCNGVTGHTGAPMTSDVLDYLCAEDSTVPGGLRRSTAALLSARFPYISPSGRMYRCSKDDIAIGVVDGGYADNTGIDAMLELWRELEPMAASHNRMSTRTVKPYFLVLDNHYLPIATPRANGRIQELYIPPTTRGLPDELDDIGAEQRAKATFPGRFLAIRPEVSPGLQAPLAWSLSPLSIKDLDTQRRNAMCRPDVVAFKEKLRLPLDGCGHEPSQ